MEAALAAIASAQPRFNLWRGEPDFAMPPSVREAGATFAINGRYGYNSGLLSLADAIARSLSRRVSREFEPEEVCITHGATGGIFSALRAFATADDEVIYLSPAWPRIPELICLAGARPIPMSILSAELHKVARRMRTPKTRGLIITNPHNPTGRVLSKSELEGLAEFAREYSLFIISDETYERFVYTPAVHTSFLDVSQPEDIFAVVHSFSKTYAMAGWRIGYVVAPKKMRSKIQEVSMAATGGISLVSQHAALEALDISDAYISLNVEKLRLRRDATLRALQESRYFDCESPDGAFFLFPQIPNAYRSSRTFCKDMLLHGVGLLPGAAFGEDGEGFVRLSLLQPEQNLRTAVSILLRAVSDIDR